MVTFPNCKINIGLHIVEKRTDGYHNLETVFYPLPFTDALEIITDTNLLKTELSLTGLPIAGDGNNNLCLKAWQLVHQHYPQVPPVKIHLHKNIPMGAGLGGGSADGAFTLLLLNKKFELGLSDDALAALALELGSDCPFFIYNKPVFATARGENVEQVSLSLSDYSFLIVSPGLHISTAQAFSLIKPAPAPVDLRKAIKEPVESWKSAISNDFEAGAVALYPELAILKSWLYQHGALYVSMSGSGSSFYGIFPKNELPLSASGYNWHTHAVI